MPGVLVNFMCLIVWVMVPRYVVKHYSDISVRMFLDEIIIYFLFFLFFFFCRMIKF